MKNGGTVPTQKGKIADMEELYGMIQAGYTNAEILAINNDYILNIDKLDKLRTMLLTEKFKDTRRTDLIGDLYQRSHWYRKNERNFGQDMEYFKCVPCQRLSAPI